MKNHYHHFKSWIFDMDGTLTVACHNFDEIRTHLGLPQGAPILEALERYPKDHAQKLYQQLFEYEMDLAHQAEPQPGAEQLLSVLSASGYKIGIVTRNSIDIAYATLKACGLINYFETENILGRECCAPKPDPAGVLKLMAQWRSNPEETVMVGDYLFDLQSGHTAGTYTIHFDVHGKMAWPDVTHFKISEFDEVTNLLLN